MIYHFILNPKSGRSLQQKRMEQEIVDACAKRQLSYHIYYTTQRRNAITYVRSMVKEYPNERQRFICVGGDGTINEIANSAPANPNIEFGVIPSGSGNDFVRNFKHRRRFADIDAQIDGTAHSFDLIKCNDDYCVNMVNIGFDCSVVIEADKFRKYKFISPSISYILGVIVGFFFKKFGTKMKVIFDDGEVVVRILRLPLSATESSVAVDLNPHLSPISRTDFLTYVLLTRFPDLTSSSWSALIRTVPSLKIKRPRRSLDTSRQITSEWNLKSPSLSVLTVRSVMPRAWNLPLFRVHSTL